MAKANKAKAEKAKPKAAGLMTQVAVENLAFAMGRAADIDEVLKQAGVSRQRLSVLMSDDEVAQAMETRLDAVLNAPWRFVEDQGEQTVFLKELFTRWHFEIVAGAWEACPYGYSVMEANYFIDENNRFSIAEIGTKPMEWFEPKNDGALIFRKPQANTEIDVFKTYPLKFFLTRRKPSYKQPYGDPLLSKLYWLWFFKTNSTKFWVKFLERFGSPLLVGRTKDTEEMTTALLNAHSQSVIAIDSNDEVTTVGTNFSGAGSSAFEAFDTVMTRRIQKVVLGQTLTSGTDGTGSRALGEVHNEVRLDKRNSDLRMITPVVQDIINALCLLNGFEKHTIILGGEQDLNIKVVERDLKLKDLGVQFNDQYIIETYGIKPEHFKVNVKSDSTPVQQFSALPKRVFSFKADMQGLDQNQQEVDDKISEIKKVLFSESELMKVVETSTDLNDLQNNLYKLMSGESVEKFNETMARALYLFDVIGYVQRSK